MRLLAFTVFFITPVPSMTDTYATHSETYLAQALANAARNELATCMREQRLLPWLEIDELVSKDEVRLFEMIENATDKLKVIQ